MRIAALLAGLTFVLPAVLAAPGQAVPPSDNAVTGLLARSSSGIDVAHRSAVDSTSHKSLITRDLPGITEEDVKALAEKWSNDHLQYVKNVVAGAYRKWPQLNWLIVPSNVSPGTSKLHGQEGTHWASYNLDEVSPLAGPSITYTLFGIESGTTGFTSDNNLWAFAGRNVASPNSMGNTGSKVSYKTLTFVCPIECTP